MQEALARAESLGFPADGVVAAAKQEFQRIQEEKQYLESLSYCLSLSPAGPVVAIDEVGEVAMTEEAYNELAAALDAANQFNCNLTRPCNV